MLCVGHVVILEKIFGMWVKQKKSVPELSTYNERIQTSKKEENNP